MRLFNRYSLGLILAASIASPLVAAPVTYTVDSTHTFPRFEYEHMQLSLQNHSFLKTTGTIEWDKDAEQAQVDISVDMDSVSTGSDTLDKSLRSNPEFFDTANYPTAHFTSTSIHFEDGVPSTINGDLTIKDVTLPVTLEVTKFSNHEHPMAKKDAIGAVATTSIKRSDFNANGFASSTSDNIDITLSLEAIASE